MDSRIRPEEMTGGSPESDMCEMVENERRRRLGVLGHLARLRTPLTATGRVAWHRTAASASCDLVYDPLDYEADPTLFTLTRLDTIEDLAVDIRTLGDRLLPALAGFFQPVISLEEVLAAFLAKGLRPLIRFGSQNCPEQQLASAFLLAKLGQRQAAQETLERFLVTFEVRAWSAQHLRGLLGDCASQ
jgi:hypothetical protein